VKPSLQSPRSTPTAVSRETEHQSGKIFPFVHAMIAELQWKLCL